MKIDIRDIPVYYINLDSDITKMESMESMLKDYGFKNVNRFAGRLANHPTVGCAMSHKAILDNIISSNQDIPFLILEDDAKVLNDFDPIVEVPDESDAVYLGLTTSARLWNYTVSDQVAKKINENYYQIYNQLSAHAIMYTNIDYVKFLSKAINTAIKLNSHQDIVRASTMKFFNVYAKNKPIFFQNDLNQRNDLQTSVLMEKMSIIAPSAMSLGFTCYCHRHR